MNYVLVFHPKVEQEFFNAIVWYESEGEGLGRRFQFAIEKKLKIILRNPELVPISRKNYREAVIERFPIFNYFQS